MSREHVARSVHEHPADEPLDQGAAVDEPPSSPRTLVIVSSSAGLVQRAPLAVNRVLQCVHCIGKMQEADRRLLGLFDVSYGKGHDRRTSLCILELKWLRTVKRTQTLSVPQRREESPKFLDDDRRRSTSRIRGSNCGSVTLTWWANSSPPRVFWPNRCHPRRSAFSARSRRSRETAASTPGWVVRRRVYGAQTMPLTITQRGAFAVQKETGDRPISRHLEDPKKFYFDLYCITR